ncbi:MAG: N-acetylneuraminate synthase family protein [Bacteroidota bacterium]
MVSGLSNPVFDESQWKSIIAHAGKTKDIWIDVFDNYSVKIIQENLSSITGLKFQVSTLDNVVLFNNLKKIDLSEKRVIVNVASLDLELIKYHLAAVQEALNPKEIIVQIGFQDYPTQFMSSGLSKIDTVKSNFNNRICFADHVEGVDEDAIDLPFAAYLKGCELIEKHVMRGGEKAKYDHYSSVTPDVFEKLYAKLNKYNEALRQPFVNEREINYLEKSLFKPCTKKELKAGQLISYLEDLEYKRSNGEGLHLPAIKKMQSERYILKNAKQPKQMLQAEDFKKAKIATIIACRLKSSRLPKKAIEKIGNISSVEYCIKNALQFKHVDHTILATSTLPDDAELKNYTYDPRVIFHTGHPEDVIKRYLDVIDKMDIDVIIRVTADMPYISDDILQILLKSHFETGADYTRAKDAAVGQNLEIINAQALRYVKSFFPEANYSEYMTWYFINNSERFKINEVDLPKEMIRSYRLTLDYPEDLEMFNRIEDYFKGSNKQVTLHNLFEYLDAHPEVASINGHLTLKYKTDQTLIDTLNKATKIPANASA